MSNYRGRAINPSTGKAEDAEFLDDYFGRHRYGVRFADGIVIDADKVEEILPPMEWRDNHWASGWQREDGTWEIERHQVGEDTKGSSE